MRDGKRDFGQQIEVRCWDSVDARTATPTRLPFEVLEQLAAGDHRRGARRRQRHLQHRAQAALDHRSRVAGDLVTGANAGRSFARPACQTISVRFPAGAAHVDVYRPETAEPAPLVIVAHGFWRNRHSMSEWGRYLAAEGFVAAVPDLPAWSDHARNGRFVSDLRAYFCTSGSWDQRIDSSRIGLMGSSAGGLATLLSAIDDPEPALWVGLDPVDRKGMGARRPPWSNAVPSC